MRKKSLKSDCDFLKKKKVFHEKEKSFPTNRKKSLFDEMWMYLWTVKKKKQQQVEEAEDGIISSFIDFEKN